MHTINHITYMSTIGWPIGVGELSLTTHFYTPSSGLISASIRIRQFFSGTHPLLS